MSVAPGGMPPAQLSGDDHVAAPVAAQIEEVLVGAISKNSLESGRSEPEVTAIRYPELVDPMERPEKLAIPFWAIAVVTPATESPVGLSINSMVTARS